MEPTAQSMDYFPDSYSGRLSDFDPVTVAQSHSVSQSEVREFRLLDSKIERISGKGYNRGAGEL